MDKWNFIILLLMIIIDFGHSQQNKACPSQELILPCRCLLREKEYQIWCSHSDLPRVLDGLKALGQHIFDPIDELILENNNLPSLPGKAFLPLKVMRLMLRYNSLERVSNGWLAGLENSLMELFIVEPDLRSLPDESLLNQNLLEAITIQSNLMKRLPNFSNLPKLRYLQIQSLSLIELSQRHYRNLPNLQKFHISGSPRLEKLEGGLLQDLPRLQLVNISFCGISWMHLRSITRLPILLELSLVGNRISDAGMIGRAARELPSLETLRLDYNDIEHIGEAAFVDLPALKRLYLSNNHITELRHGAFHRVPMLRTLDLNNNHVRRVHPESFLQHSGSGLEELWLMNNDISHVGELRSLLDALPRLTFLDMSHNSLESIPFGALRGHPTLEYFRLDYNKLHVIEREAFMAMPALRELRLKNNSLTDRLETPFWNLPALKGLDLSGNFFRRIEPRLLTNLPSLRKVDFNGNDINIVDPASFLQTADLEHVNLSYNALTTLHPATFRHLLNLYELDVSHNGILEFVPGLPRGIEYLFMSSNVISHIPLPPSPDLDLPSLRMLDISLNEVQRIPGGVFRTLPQLRKLYLGNNALQQLDENSFTGLSRIEVLDLRENRISKLSPSTLRELNQLKELNLRENRLDILLPEVFEGTAKLEKLDISRNKLSEVLTGTLEHTRHLQVMDASHNFLVQLPPGLYGMKKLRALDLSNNRLKSIHPDTLSSLISLEELKMSKNFVEELRRGAFDRLPNLTILELDNNELSEMESKAINDLPALKSIKLGRNKLKEVPSAAFSGLPSLQIAELQENELRLIAPNAFHQVPHLLMLNLSYNYFAGLEDAGLRSVRSLEMLDLSNNKLGIVSSQTLEKMEWLVELRMDNNQICSVFGTTFNGMPRLRVLSMKNNKMMTFPEHTVQKLRGNIAVLDIDGNPLACTCSLLWLRAWLQEQSVMGPRCLDGSLLREIRLSREECLQEERQAEPLAPGCDAELLPGTSQVFTKPWLNLRDNRTKLNNVAPSPEESDYFYDEYIDYPYNETIAQQHQGYKRPQINSSHYTAGDTPVIYAATSKNKTKTFDAPKEVVNSPSSSGFTFFGLPLPSLNLNSLLGSNIRMNDKGKSTSTDSPLTAQRKAAIVNKPNRHPSLLQEFQTLTKIPDLPERHTIIGMLPPSHPEIESGGFIPYVPGSTGGFKPMSPEQINRKNNTHYGSIEKVNISQVASPSNAITESTSLRNNSSNIFIKRGPVIATTTNPSITENFAVTTDKQLEYVTVTKPDNVYDEEYDDNQAGDTKEDTTARIQEIQQIQNLSQMFGVTPTKSPDLKHINANFDDIFKEVIENVSVPILATPAVTTTDSHIENLVNYKPKDDPIPTFIGKTKQPTIETTKHVIGTPLSALLIPGGEVLPNKSSGRSKIVKVESQNGPGTQPLQSSLELIDATDDIMPQAHNRESKNSFYEPASDSTPNSDESMSWYFANYNKTNLEPYVGHGGLYPSSASKINVNLAVFLFMYLLI